MRGEPSINLARSPGLVLRRARDARAARLLGTAIALSLLVASLPACRHSGAADIGILTTGTEQTLWTNGEQDIKKAHWESGRQYLRRLIEGYPQSQHQPLARLMLADSFFNEGGTANYVLASAEYQEFATLYPSHTRADYARSQVAECYFRQRLGPDRDQTNTERALQEFQRFLELYPASPLVDTAKMRVQECRSTLARGEFLVGSFYQRSRQAWSAAIQRYQGILTQYPEYPHMDEVRFRLAECLIAADRAAEAAPHLAAVLQDYPSSRFREEAKRLLLRAGPAGSAGPSGPSPTPAPAPRQ
jgi:outer membrane assembly lipoprotein YfiO